MALTPQQRRRMRFNQLLMMQMSMAAYASTKAQDLSAAAELLATWADSNGGLAFDFTDITSTQPFGSGKIIDGATPANSWSTSPTVTNFDKLTWTGASLRMCYGSDGVLRYAPHNLMVRSQEFDNASWTKTSVAVSANATTAPDGTTTADLVYPSSSGSDRRITQGVTVNNGMAYENRIYAKYAGIRWVRVSSSSASSSLDEAWFDVQNGVAGTYGANISSTSIVASGDGWYRLTVTEITNKAFGDAIFISLVDADGGTSVTANGTDGVYLWGAQLQALPVHSTDYIATTSSAVYKPRIDYDPSTLAVRGLLVEEARTNLCLRSQEFDNASWVKGGTATVTANNTTAPDGTSTADKLNGGASGGNIYQSITGSVSTTYTWSIYAKPSTNATRFQIYVGGGGVGGSDGGYRFNASTGAYVSTVGAAPTSYSSQVLSDGWIRYTLTFATSGADGTFDISCQFYDDAFNDNDVDGFIWGAQLEAGSFATSYIPTTSASVTRAADAVSLATSAFNYGSSAITLYNEAQVGTASAKNCGLLVCSDSDGDPYVGMRTEASASKIYGLVSDGTFQAAILPNVTISANATFKSAFGVTANLFDCAVNATLGTQDTSGTYPAAQTLRMTGDLAGSGQGQTWYRKIMQLPRKLTPADLQTLTT